MTPEQKEQIARQNGFSSFEQMMLWQRQRANPTGGTIAGAGVPVGSGMPTTIRGATQQVRQHPMHPANIFKYIGDALRNATGGE